MQILIDIPKRHYENIKSIDSVSLGRIPYKGIVMYSINAIKNGVVQEPRKGHWEHGKELGKEYLGRILVDITYEDWHCSNCHCVIDQSSKPKWNYCPNCGCRMVEPQESETDY